MNQKILKNALEELSKNPKIDKLIQKFGSPNFSQTSDHFNALCKSIIYQQLSGKAARTIYNRFLGLFNYNLPKASEVVNIDISKFRNIGISKQKSSYIIGLAEYFYKDGNKIDFDNLSDLEVSQELIKIKGIGQWTIDMFLMFTLQRIDILPIGDLGIKKGIKIMFNMKNLPSNKYMIQKSKKWRPYRTVACWYLWRMIDEENTW